jgi:hypothetical protein
MSTFAPNAARNSQQQRAARRANGPPSAERMDQLATRAETSGYDRCGARFADLLPYFICRTITGGFSARCADCSRVDAAPVLLAECHGTGGNRRSQDDRDWFAAHANRRWRLHEPWRGEAAALAIGHPFIDVEAAITTFQVAIGKRQRTIVAVATSDRLDSFTDLGIARRIPGLADGMIQTADAEWQQMAVDQITNRIGATAGVVKGGVP